MLADCGIDTMSIKNVLILARVFLHPTDIKQNSDKTQLFCYDMAIASSWGLIESIGKLARALGALAIELYITPIIIIPQSSIIPCLSIKTYLVAIIDLAGVNTRDTALTVPFDNVR